MAKARQTRDISCNEAGFKTFYASGGDTFAKMKEVLHG